MQNTKNSLVPPVVPNPVAKNFYQVDNLQIDVNVKPVLIHLKPEIHPETDRVVPLL